MKLPTRKSRQQKPQHDPRVVAVFCREGAGFAALTARAVGGGIELIANARFAEGDARAGAWANEHLAARRIVALPGASVIVRMVQLPNAPEERLESALQLNATTFILGRTPAWRVAAALLPRERGTGIRTGVITEWPVDDPVPELPGGVTEGTETSFAPEVAALAALARAAEDPLVSVDALRGAITICVPSTRGLLARVVRAGGDGSVVDEQEITRAVGEACVHASVPADETPRLIARAREAASGVLRGGFGCTPEDALRLARLVGGVAEGDQLQWWRGNGILAGIALAALGPANALTRMQSRQLDERADRAGRLLNRLAEPRTARRLLVAGLLTLALGPLVLEGGRLALLRWKLPDLTAYHKAEELDRKRQAVYRMLAQHSASVTKTLADLACNAPPGIEIDFVNMAQSAKGQSITVRAKARPVGGQQSSEVILAMEDLMRKSGAYENIVRSSELPSQQGWQDFTINAVAVRPTMSVAYPEEQDYAKTPMRNRIYGEPPENVDRVASGLDAAADGSMAAASDGEPAATGSRSTSHASGSRGSRSASSSSGAASHSAGAGSTVAGSAAAGSTPAHAAAGNAGASSAGAASATPAADGTAHNAATTGAATAAAGTDGAATPTGASSRSAASGAVGRAGLATRGTPGATNEPEPPPAPISATEINAMSKEEAREALVRIARSRNRADLDDAVKARLKSEFDQLIERCKRD